MAYGFILLGFRHIDDTIFSACDALATWRDMPTSVFNFQHGFPISVL